MNPNSAYRADIDGLRAVAVFAVVLHHLSASLVPGGYVGVDVFFVISGYLITGIISREMEEGTFTFARFYERRARRIFPALFAMLTVTLVVGYFLLLPSDYSATLRGALGTLFFSSNIVFWRDMAAGYFAATDAGLNPLLHTWSLAVEEQFYVLFPFLLLLCFRFFRRHIVLTLIGCVVVSLTGAALLIQSKTVAVFFLSPFRAWELLVGSLLAFNVVPIIKSRSVREVVAVAGLLAIVAACFLYDSNTTFPGLAAVVPVLGAAAVMHAGASGSSLVGLLLQWRPVVYIGLISYSLYLWHWPLIVLVRYATGMDSITPYIPVLLLASLALGSLSYHFIEQPFRRGVKVSRRYVFFSAAGVVSALALVSVLGLVSGGFEKRFSPTVVQLDKAKMSNIPFVECDGQPQASWCTLGSASAKVSVLLWGDSHLLAWAPALNQSLAKLGRKAMFVTTSGCPPLLGIGRPTVPLCASRNLRVKEFLASSPHVEMVVMSANWPGYFREDGKLTSTNSLAPAQGVIAAQQALIATHQWLRDNKKYVVLIGPVPVYERSVPLALARSQVTGHKFISSSADMQQKKNAAFFEVVEAEKQGGRNFRFLNPIQWMCADECEVMKNGVSLYRDKDHLSLAGAMGMETNILQGLTVVSEKLGQVQPVVTAPTP